jgi:hypothetical protein
MTARLHPMTVTLLLPLALALAAAEPNTCQPRSARPFMPIYHTIGESAAGVPAAASP